MRESGISGLKTNGVANPATMDAQTIVEGILAEADAQAAHLLDSAEAELQARRSQVSVQLAAMLREIQDDTERQTKRILKAAGIKAANEQRKTELAFGQQLEAQLVSAALERLAGLVTQPGYDRILMDWIVEAAIGLDSDTATVFCSPGELELIDRILLDRAEREILVRTGKSVRLSAGGVDTLKRQGIMLVADTGRIAYDNTVQARLERKRPVLRSMIQATVRSEEQS